MKFSASFSSSSAGRENERFLASNLRDFVSEVKEVFSEFPKVNPRAETDQVIMCKAIWVCLLGSFYFRSNSFGDDLSDFLRVFVVIRK